MEEFVRADQTLFIPPRFVSVGLNATIFDQEVPHERPLSEANSAYDAQKIGLST